MKPIELRKFLGTTLEDVLRYLKVDISKTFQDFFTGLKHLSFTDNFDFWIETVTIPAATTIPIGNKIGRTDIIWWGLPSTNTGYEYILLGEGGITGDSIFLRNYNSVEVTATLIFMRK